MKKIILFVFLFTSLYYTQAQDIEQFLLAGRADASKLTKEYARPVAKGFMAGLNNGWYTTARTHNKFGFDITFVANMAMVPSSDEAFSFIASDFNNLTLKSGPSEIQTLFGSANSTILRASVKTGEGKFDVSEFSIPDGIGGDLPLSAVPSAALQIGFGIPVIDADIKLRYLPKIGNSDLEVGMIGFAIQKSLNKMLKLKLTPFSVSVLAAFTKLSADYDIQSNSGFKGSGQKMEFITKAYTFQAIASVNLKIVEFYAAAGYNKADLDLDLKGTYNIEYDSGVKELMIDPVSINYNASGMRATIGSRLNLGFFKIFADYTLQEYNTVSAGISLSFR